MTTVPSAVRAMARPVAPRLTDPTAASPMRGDVRLVHPLAHESGPPRIALILDVDRAHDVIDIALVHSHPDLATDSDVIVPKAIAGTQFPVVIQSDLRSAVWKQQLGGLVGRIDAAGLAMVNDALDPVPQGPSSHLSVGLPLDGPSDGRWEFKHLEGEDLRRLTADCSRAVLDDETDWELDPKTIVPGQSPDVLLELMHWLQTRTVQVSESAHEYAAEVYAHLTKNSWGEYSDVASALIDALADVLMAEPVPRAHGRRRAFLTTASIDVTTIGEFDVVQYLGVEVELV